MGRIAIAVALALTAAACSHQEPRGDDARTSSDAGKGTATAAASSSTATAAARDSVSGDPLRDPHSLLAQRSVYFDYDSNEVKDQYRDMIRAHARYMVDRKAAHARVEGNSDERGSREYNLALGQRRAEAVKRVMTVLGVDPARIETVSFGEEKPMAAGHDESAWSKNRRDDIKYRGE